MYLIESEIKDFGISLPENVSEITPEMLNKLMYGVYIPKHYCAVAVCLRIKLFDIVSTLNGPSDFKKNATISTNCLLAKINGEGDLMDSCKVGDRLLIERTSLERATHLSVNSYCSYNKVCSYIDEDKDLLKRLIKQPKQYVVLIEFKIVPVNDIRACIPAGYSTEDDPFKVATHVE